MTLFFVSYYHQRWEVAVMWKMNLDLPNLSDETLYYITQCKNGEKFITVRRFSFNFPVFQQNNSAKLLMSKLTWCYGHEILFSTLYLISLWVSTVWVQQQGKMENMKGLHIGDNWQMFNKSIIVIIHSLRSHTGIYIICDGIFWKQ